MEERLREGLSSEVDRFRHRDRTLLGPPRLGPAVRKRVRRRQLGTALVSLILAAGLAFGGVQAVSAFTEGSNQKIVPATQPPPSGTQQTPVGWPTIGSRLVSNCMTYAATCLLWSSLKCYLNWSRRSRLNCPKALCRLAATTA